MVEKAFCLSFNSVVFDFVVARSQQQTPLSHKESSTFYVSWNLLSCGTIVQKITLKKACKNWM